MEAPSKLDSEELVKELVALKRSLKSKERANTAIRLAVDKDRNRLLQLKDAAIDRMKQKPISSLKARKAKPKPPGKDNIMSEDHMKFNGMGSQRDIWEELKLFKKHELDLDVEAKMLKTTRARIANQLQTYGEAPTEPFHASMMPTSRAATSKDHGQDRAEAIERAVHMVEELSAAMASFDSPTGHECHPEGRLCGHLNMHKSTVYSLKNMVNALGKALEEVVGLYKERGQVVNNLETQIFELQAEIRESREQQEQLIGEIESLRAMLQRK